MFKNLVFVAAAVASVGAFAATSGQASGKPHYDAKSFCTYENEVYSIGAKIKVEGAGTLECFQPGWGKGGSSNINTAHWD